MAIIPQLIVVHKYASQQNGFVENLNATYVFLLGGYRAMYLLNWLYRILTEKGYRSWIVWIAGLVQTGIYCDFFYYYITAYAVATARLRIHLSRRRIEGKSMSLPI